MTKLQRFLKNFSIILVLSTTGFLSAQQLDEQNVEQWKNHIRPSSEELAWTQINWLPDLQSGIEEARRTGKPILLWTMNGHPFGCT